jgi:ankyrin repeat protein
MKDIVKKYQDTAQKLEQDLSLNKSIKDNIKRCLAIYINGEILRAFYHHVQQSCVVVSPDMIAFFYLHVQMSGAANECLSRNFTDAHPKLKDVLFDQTADGSDAPRILRFAGAHSESLSALLNSYTPRLLSDYIDIIEEILPELEKVILSRVPSLASELGRVVKIDFFAMQQVDVSSAKFRLTSPHTHTGRILESLKAIDIIAPILKQHAEFYKSESGQSFAIMARQIFANIIHELQKDDETFDALKSWAQDNNVSLAELRAYRNKSAHGFVMWEIQYNPIKLRFNCLRLVVAMRKILLELLEEASPDHHLRYLNKPVLENKVAEEDCVLEAPLEENGRPTPDRRKARKKKPVAATEDFCIRESEGGDAEKNALISTMVFKIVQFIGYGKTQERIKLFKMILEGLERANSLPQEREAFRAYINAPLSAVQIKRGKKSTSNGYRDTTYHMLFVDTDGNEATISIDLCDKKYPKGIKKFQLNIVSGLLYLLQIEKQAFSKKENLDLCKEVLQAAFDLCATPNIKLQGRRSEIDALSFIVFEQLPEELVPFLIENGASINNAVDDKMYLSSLNYAARSRPNLVMLLLQAGCNPLDIVYDPSTDTPCTSSIFYDVYTTPEADLMLRMRSLKILFPYIYQIYGEEALLTNMRIPMNFINGVVITARNIILKMKKENDPSLQCLLLHQKVETVLTNPRFNFYKLILNDEIEIMVQEIERLGSSQEILVAMGIADGVEEARDDKKWTAVEFAVDMGLIPLAVYLGRVRAFCQAPSVSACNDMARYFSNMEVVLYNVLNINLKSKCGYGPSVLDHIIDYWGRGAEQQSVAHYCL